MQFADTPEQAMLRETVRAFAVRHGTPAQVRATIASPAGYETQTWARLALELGLTALPVPEEFGGAGGGFAEVAVAAEELGRVLLPTPYLSTALAGLVLTRATDHGSDAAERFLPELAGGSLIGALALDADVAVTQGRVSGTAWHVVDGAQAGLLLVRAGDQLLAVAAADAAIDSLETLDQTRRQATVRFDGAPATATGPADVALQWQRVLLAAESVAAAEHCLAATVEYLKTRRQFGRPIGSFQALQHRCADLAVALASARATAQAAVWTADSDPAGLAVLAPLAAMHCSRTFMRVAGEMIQLHGGIGFTWEHESHLYFKRAKSTQLLLGSVSGLRTEVAREAGLIPDRRA